MWSNLSLLNTRQVFTESTYDVDEKITNAEDNEIDNPVYDANKSGKKEVEIAVPSKYLKNLWRILDMPLINCEVCLILTWSEGCAITSMERRVTAARRRDTSPTGATFKIRDAKLYVLVVNLSAENDKCLLEQLRTGLKKTIKWNKYRSEITNRTQNNNFNYLIDPTFTKVNKLFVLSFENENDRNLFQSIMYQMSK